MSVWPAGDRPVRPSAEVDDPNTKRGLRPPLTLSILHPMDTPDDSQTIAIVDDDEALRGALHGLLREVGFPARAFASAEEFLDSGQQHVAACLIADIGMPGMSGLDLQAKLNADRITIPTIFITAHGDERLRLQALRSGAVEFLLKPFDDEVLLESVRAALDRRPGMQRLLP